MRILIATGGTGGHIYPALALADIALQNDASTEILFIGNEDRMETTIIPDSGYDFLGIAAKGFNNAAANKFTSLKLMFKAYSKCKNIIKDFKPDAVIGFGGYVSVPVLLAASRLKIPTFLHEQNSIAGMANKFLARFVKKVFVSYQSSLKDFPSKKTLLLGNPRATIAHSMVSNKEFLKSYGLSNDKKTVFIVMGSLGSSSVNDKMITALNSVDAASYQVVYVTGKENYEQFVSRVNDNPNIKILPYIDQVQMLANCDLVVSRGGATSAAEITALNVPSIIIPSPFVPNNHQFLNAKELLDNGCSILVEEKDLETTNIVEVIEQTINDDSKLCTMSDCAKKLGFPRAAYDILSVIVEEMRVNR